MGLVCAVIRYFINDGWLSYLICVTGTAQTANFAQMFTSNDYFISLQFIAFELSPLTLLCLIMTF